MDQEEFIKLFVSSEKQEIIKWADINATSRGILFFWKRQRNIYKQKRQTRCLGVQIALCGGFYYCDLSKQNSDAGSEILDDLSEAVVPGFLAI